MATFVTYPEISPHLIQKSVDLPEPMPDDEITWLCRPSSLHALSVLRECRNICMKTYLNLRRLQLAGFYGTQFSMIIADPKRGNVARMVMVNVSDVFELPAGLES